MSNNIRAVTPELARFREIQRLTYDCAEEVAAGLTPGVTEREAARRFRKLLRGRGTDDWLHVPFAWFGDRTAFRGKPWTPLHFLPSNRRLEEGMPFILDAAPVKNGYAADIGYAACLGENRVFDTILDDLAEYRSLILELVRERRKLADIYAEVDALIAWQGYDNRHRVYPGRVIAHQVTTIESRLPKVVVGSAFGLRFLQTLGREFVKERLEGRSPLWAGGRASRHAPTPGLWAVEPHIAFRDVGVKFEEILVVTETDAWWLDDDLPHVRRWHSRER